MILIHHYGLFNTWYFYSAFIRNIINMDSVALKLFTGSMLVMILLIDMFVNIEVTGTSGIHFFFLTEGLNTTFDEFLLLMFSLVILSIVDFKRGTSILISALFYEAYYFVVLINSLPGFPGLFFPVMVGILTFTFGAFNYFVDPVVVLFSILRDFGNDTVRYRLKNIIAIMETIRRDLFIVILLKLSKTDLLLMKQSRENKKTARLKTVIMNLPT